MVNLVLFDDGQCKVSTRIVECGSTQFDVIRIENVEIEESRFKLRFENYWFSVSLFLVMTTIVFWGGYFALTITGPFIGMYFRVIVGAILFFWGSLATALTLYWFGMFDKSQHNNIVIKTQQGSFTLLTTKDVHRAEHIVASINRAIQMHERGSSM